MHRTMRQEHCVLRNSSSGLSIYSSPLISTMRCGGDIDCQHDTYRWSWLSFRSQLNLHTAEQGLQNLHTRKLYTLSCDWRRGIKPYFFYGDTTSHYLEEGKDCQGVSQMTPKPLMTPCSYICTDFVFYRLVHTLGDREL